MPRLIFLLLIILFCPLNLAQARVYLDITSADLRKVPVAVPFFAARNGTAPGDNAAGRDMADLLARALSFHGFISIIPAESYGGGMDADWLGLGADFYVSGLYEFNGAEIVLEIKLVDVNEGRMVFGRRYRGSRSLGRQMIKKFCDETIQKLTGTQGISLSEIAFVAEINGIKEIYLADVLGDEIRQITRHRSLAVSPRFSPDSLKLSYTSYHRGNPNLYVTELSQDKTTRAISRRKGLNMTPAWRPDGRAMVVTLSKDGNPDLYLMNMNGKIMDRLTINAGINVSPCWSPDGRRLAFVSDRNGTPQIYVMEAKTRAVRRLTFQGNENTTPSWSPDGMWIAYTCLHEGHHQIFIIPAAGGSPVQLTSGWGEHESPSWSPDSRQLVFSRKRNGNQGLYVIFRNGAGFRSLFEMKGRLSSPQWSSRLKF